MSDTPNPTPTQVAGAWDSLTAGGGDTCGVKTDDTAWCWGYNYSGQLGNATNVGTVTPNPTPAQVAGAWNSLDAGTHHTCGVKTDNTAWCWGGNLYGEVGPGTDVGPPNPTPTQVPGAWSSLTTGDGHTCGVKTDNTAWCWGSNDGGQLGTTTPFIGTTTPNPTKVQVPGAWGALAAGSIHTCGLQSDDTAWCWGLNRYGQLGTDANVGTFQPNPTPIGLPG
jgi:alpha-tubulin suppressor-like RCC1 family protein